MGIPRVVELIVKGVRSPDRIGPYLADRYSNIKFDVSVWQLPDQKDKIQEFVQQDEFALVILDACRFDYFEDEVDDFLDGELCPVYTPVTATVDWVPAIWDGKHEDVTYITGTPTPTDHTFKRKDREYRPSEHFAEFVHVWDTCQNKELGAVPPETLTKTALQHLPDKMIVHYIQPHAPYIGDYRLRTGSTDSSLGSNLHDVYERIGRYDLEEKTIPDRDLRKAYRSNLRRALASVRELSIRLDRPVVVTSDHGEMLGEDGRYIHGGPRHRHLCTLPWFELDASTIESEPLEEIEADRSNESTEKSEFTEQDVEEQLKDLGYL